MGRNYKEITEYVEEQHEYKCKVVSAKVEQYFNDFGFKVNVWNVKTDREGDWRVVEGEESLMNLYPQDAFYMSSDEVYSFHIGLMDRMKRVHSEYKAEDYIKAVSVDREIAPILLRRLKTIATQIDSIEEIEEFQSIGVQCREILIELGNDI